MPQNITDDTERLIVPRTKPVPISRARLKWLTFDSVFISFCCSFSIGFLIFAYTISLVDPEYFKNRVLASMRPAEIDSTRTASLAAAAKAALVGLPMPGPRLVRAREPVPADYQIITVFEREAILATPDELLRVKIGSTAPGLGEILSIAQNDAGFVVQTTKATLKSDVN